MSDVSGIPYMGSMGQGNYFASPYPALSGGGNASWGQTASAYMPEVINNQNALQNLYTGGSVGLPGFGRQTDYYSGLGASYSAQGMSPFGVFNDPGTGGGRGGGASPYQTTPNVFDTGASGFGYPGAGAIDWGGLFGSVGGASPYQTSSDVFSRGSSGFQFPGAGAIDWGGLSRSAPQLSAPDFGAGMFGGLAGGMGGANQGPNNPMDFSRLFSGGGGGAAAAPQLQQPQQQSQQPDFNDLFTQRSGGLGGGQAAMPGDLGTAPAAMPSSDKLLGYTPQEFPQQSPFDVGAAPITGRPGSGGMAAGGLDWGEATGQTYTLPSQPNTSPLRDEPVTEAYNPYFGVTSPYGERSGGSGGEVQGPSGTDPGGGLTAANMGEQARTRLAELMSSERQAETPIGPPAPIGPPEPPPDAMAIPLPRRRPDEAPTAEPGAAPARPADRVDTSLQGRIDTLRNTLKKELEAGGLVMTSDYRGPGHELYRPGSQHSNALAFDTRARTPEQADVAMGKLRELFAARGMVEGRDYKFIDEVRKPIGGITKGPHVHTTLTPEGMQRYQQSAFDVNQGQVIPRPPADIPYPQGIPLPAERPSTLGRRSDLGTSDATDFSARARTPLEGTVQPPTAAGAVAPAGAGPVASSYWNVPQQGTPEWNQQVYEPMGSSLIMRRGDETTGGGDHYADFPRTGNVEDRRNEQLSRDQLAALKARGTGYAPGPEVAPTQLGNELGLGNLPMPKGVATAGNMRPQGIVDTQPEGADNVVGPRSSAFGLEPGGFGEGGYGSAFEPLGDPFKERFPAEGAFAPTPTTKTTDEFVPTRSISERAPSPAAEEMQRRYGGVGNAEIGPPKYSGFEQPYGPEYQPGEYMREQFKNHADFTLQDQAERLAGQRARVGEQLTADPELRRNTIATVLAEMGPNQTDANRLKVIESALNRLSANNYQTGMYKILGYRNAAGNYDPAGSPMQQAHQDRQYYEPFKFGERGEAPVVIRRGYDVMRDQPELAEHVGKLLDAAIKTGTNVSNLATENSSDPISARQLRLGLQSPNETAAIPGSGPELFSRKDINTEAARGEHGDPARYRNWLAGLMPPGWQWQQQPASSIPNLPPQWRR